MITGRKVRICIIGAGNMANNVHYPSLASFDDVEIVGVIESRADRLKATCDKFGIPESARFLVTLDSDYQTVLKQVQPDGVYVIGQPEIMYPIWHWCLTQGFNLYIEKPMGLNTHQAESLACLADKGGLITQVSHQLRSAPIMQQVIASRALTSRAAATPLFPDPASTHPRLRGATALVAAPLFAAPRVA